MLKTKYLSVIASAVILMTLPGCGKTPAEQCLESFKTTLKDPNSGQVISFENDLLTYTATNSYGGRVQGKAMCTQGEGGKWARDKLKESTQITERVNKVMAIRRKELDSQIVCMRSVGASLKKCTGSDTLERTDMDAIYKKAAQDLGFE